MLPFHERCDHRVIHEEGGRIVVSGPSRMGPNGTLLRDLLCPECGAKVGDESLKWVKRLVEERA